MAFSTAAQLQANLRQIPQFPELDAIWQAAVIAEADKWVQGQLFHKTGDIAELTDVPPTPDPINLLAQARACHVALFRIYGKFRKGDNSDQDFWFDEFTNQLAAIRNDETGDANIPTQTVTTNKSGYQLPRFGDGKYGERVTTDTPPTDEEGAYEYQDNG